jgi:hypothetical protein
MSPTTGSKASKSKSASKFNAGDEYDGPVAYGEDFFHHPVEVTMDDDGNEVHTALMDVRLVTDGGDGVGYRVASPDDPSHEQRFGTNVVTFPQE